MKNRIDSWHSSWLVALPVIMGCLAGGVVFAFIGWIYPAAVMIFLSVLGITARLWGRASVDRLILNVNTDKKGLFPGEEITFGIEIRNEKALPVAWTELFCPLSKDLCIVPEESRKPDEWETAMLKEEGASEELVGEKYFSLLMRNGTSISKSKWTAQKRGVYSIAGWRIRAGDGFGLMRAERRIDEAKEYIYIYPKLVPVSSELFMKNCWTSETGAKGVINDPTVIRSTRGYMQGDSVKTINWRLAARGLPLSVNIYEDILPRSVHFILDGESFFGEEQYEEGLEEVLSIMASEIMVLCAKKINCGLSLNAGLRNMDLNAFAIGEPYRLLKMMAEYTPKKYGAKSVFDEEPILGKIYETGRFYYITYDASKLTAEGIIQKLGKERVTVLSYKFSDSDNGYETFCIDRLKGGNRYE